MCTDCYGATIIRCRCISDFVVFNGYFSFSTFFDTNGAAKRSYRFKFIIFYSVTCHGISVDDVGAAADDVDKAARVIKLRSGAGKCRACHFALAVLEAERAAAVAVSVA